MTDTEIFKDGDRISHEIKGLGTVRWARRDAEITDTSTRDSVPVVWDDNRFPVEHVPPAELEKVPEASAAISTGF